MSRCKIVNAGRCHLVKGGPLVATGECSERLDGGDTSMRRFSFETHISYCGIICCCADGGGPVAGHVVIAPDKFKGSLTAAQASAAISTGLKRADPTLTTVVCPVADGGDGTLDTVLAAGFE